MRMLSIATVMSVAENALFYPLGAPRSLRCAALPQRQGAPPRPQRSSTLESKWTDRSRARASASRAEWWHTRTGKMASGCGASASPRSAREQQPTAPRRAAPQGFYKGFWTSSLGHVPPLAIYLLGCVLATAHTRSPRTTARTRSYSWAKSRLGFSASTKDVEAGDAQDVRNAAIGFAAGGVAEGLSLPFYVPVDVVATRLQVARHCRHSPVARDPACIRCSRVMPRHTTPTDYKWRVMSCGRRVHAACSAAGTPLQPTPSCRRACGG